MSQIRTTLSVSLLWLLVSMPAAAVEVLPMDAVETTCEGAQVEEPPADARPESVEVMVEAAEAPAGLQSVGAGVQSARPPAQGGGDSSTPSAAKPSSRWNAFLPGMVR